MKQTDISRSKRFISCIVGIMMLVIMLFSAFYIASEAMHECCGEDCPVCTCIQLCKNTLHQGCLTASFPNSLFTTAGIILFLPALLKVFRPQESLISRKIRMNN